MQIGQIEELVYTLENRDLASDLPVSEEDQFPAVFATSRMIALMELAAARLMRPVLNADQLSVGVTVDVNHVAATPPGQTIRATAEYLGPEGKLHRFRVEVHDAGGRVGSGTHTRAIVSTQRLISGAKQRVESAGSVG